MLRNRYRAVTTSSNKQQTPTPLLMADHHHHHHHPYTSLLSPNNKNNPSFLLPTSPRFFSPTSILDINTNNTNNNSFSYPFGVSKQARQLPQQQEEQKATGLAMIDSLLKEEDGKYSKPVNRMALFGSKLKVDIPGEVLVVDDHHHHQLQQQSSSSSSLSPPKSPGDFGIKSARNCSNNNQQTPTSTRRELFTRQLSLKEIEMSEDYTCVITHGPNPKTTHIYDDCVVECCCDDDADLNTNLDPDHAQVVEFKIKNDDEYGKEEDAYIYRGQKGLYSE